MEKTKINVGFDAWLKRSEPWNYDYELRAEGYDGEDVDLEITDSDVANVEACLFGEYAVQNEGDRISFFADEADEQKLQANMDAWEARGGSVFECWDEWLACKEDDE